MVTTCAWCSADRPCCHFEGETVCLDCRRKVVGTYAPLPAVSKTRREVTVQTPEGKTYRFGSKAEAKRTIRYMYRTKRSPAWLMEQLD